MVDVVLPRAFWVIWVGTLVNRLGTMVQPFMAFYLTSTRDLSVGQAGAVMGLFGLGSVLSPLVVGPLVDRWQRRTVLTAGMLTSAVVMLQILYSPTVAALAAGMLVLGFVLDAYRPASSALVADVVPEPARTRAFGLLVWATNLGFVAGALAGGLLARDHVHLVFWADAITCVLFGALVWFAVPASGPAPAREGRGLRTVASDRVMTVFCLITFGYAVVYLQSVSTLPLRLESQGLTSLTYGVLVAVNCVALVAVQPFFAARASDRTAGLYCTAGLVLTGLGFGATALAHSAAVYGATVLLWTLGEILFTTVSLSLVFRLAPAGLRGSYAGAYGFAWSLAAAAAPVAGSQLLRPGPAIPWVVCALVCLTAAAAQSRLTRVLP